MELSVNLFSGTSEKANQALLVKGKKAVHKLCLDARDDQSRLRRSEGGGMNGRERQKCQKQKRRAEG